jgi:transposase
MLLAAIDIHKSVLQAAVLDPESGELHDERIAASGEGLAEWAGRWRGRVAVVAVEATTGWRWVWRDLARQGMEVRLAEPAEARALRGRKRRAKTDRLDARWLVTLLAREMLPESWIPPAELQRLRDQTRLRKALADDRTRWAQRLHALLLHEGWPCQRARLLTAEGRRWVAALRLEPATRAHVDCLLRLIGAVEHELEGVEAELRRFARGDARCRALTTIYGVGPILACHLLAELGDARRFRRARQAVRAAGLDPVVSESADARRRGHLSKQGAPHLRWALVEAATHARRATSPDRSLYLATRERADAQRALLSVSRKICRRAVHVLPTLDQAPA